MNQVVRSVTRFARKWYAGQLLSARLFGGEGAVAALLEKIQESPMKEDSTLKELIVIETFKLQQWARKSFGAEQGASSSWKEWQCAVVRPALQCNVATIPKCMQDVVGRFTAVIRGGEATEEDAIALKLACSCLNGDMAAHPLVQGLALQCRRLVQREARGIHTMAGRRDDITCKEAALISDAGLSLAMLSGNVALGKEFGLSGKALRISLDELEKNSLPTPALALHFEGVLENNFMLADQRFLRADNHPKCILDYMMDCVFMCFCCLLSLQQT